MAQYQATMVDAETGGHETYYFESRDDLFKDTPVRITRAFMEYVDRTLFPKQHIDYEINATFKDSEHAVVTTIGVLLFEHDGRLPFMMMITPKHAPEKA